MRGKLSVFTRFSGDLCTLPRAVSRLNRVEQRPLYAQSFLCLSTTDNSSFPANIIYRTFVTRRMGFECSDVCMYVSNASAGMSKQLFTPSEIYARTSGGGFACIFYLLLLPILRRLTRSLLQSATRCACDAARLATLSPEVRRQRRASFPCYFSPDTCTMLCARRGSGLSIHSKALFSFVLPS